MKPAKHHIISEERMSSWKSFKEWRDDALSISWRSMHQSLSFSEIWDAWFVKGPWDVCAIAPAGCKDSIEASIAPLVVEGITWEKGSSDCTRCDPSSMVQPDINCLADESFIGSGWACTGCTGIRLWGRGSLLGCREELAGGGRRLRR